MGAQRCWNPREIGNALTFHRTGKSPEEIGALIDRSPEAVRKVLKANGICLPRKNAANIEAISKCQSYEKMKRDAATASAMLLAALEQTGLRP